MLWTIALPMIVAASDCPVAAQTIPVTITPIAPAAIGATPDPDDANVQRVGPFLYQGKGIVARSDDPRWADLVLDQRFGLTHRCGNPVFPPSPWSAPRTGSIPGGMEVHAAGMRQEAVPGAIEADQHGAKPLLDGHVAGPNWPLHHRGGKLFIGLMYPSDGADTTRIVAFRDVPRPTPARILATIPMRLQVVAIIPGLHENADYLHLAALRPTDFVNVTLRIDPAGEAAIAGMLQE